MKPDTSGPVMPAGEQPCQLISVTELPPMENSQFENNGPRWAWRFRGANADPVSGMNPESTIYTGTRYGNAKAGLTKLLTMLLPGKSDAERADTDTDTLVGQWYDIMWTQEPKASGGVRNGWLYAKPYGAPAAPAPVIAPPVTATAAPAAPQPPVAPSSAETTQNPFPPHPAAVNQPAAASPF